MQFFPRYRAASACALAAATIALVAGCGSSDDDSTTGAAGATGATQAAAAATTGSDAAATIAEFSKPVTWPGPNDPVTPPAGKRITIIICGSQGITCVRVGDGAKAASQALGYQATVVDGQSQPQVWNQAISSAVTNRSDAIVLAGLPPALVTGALAKAKSAGIPVAAVLSPQGPATDVRVSYDRQKVAEANSAFIAQDSGGKASVLVARDGEFPETLPTVEAYPQELAKFCDDCKVAKTVDFTLALASQRFASSIASALRNDPSINYITLPFDGVVPFVEQGIAQAGRTGKVKIVGVGADPPSITAIKAGSEAASLGTPAEWMGWDALDGLVRVMAGKPVPPLDADQPGGATNYDVPERLITKDDLPGPEGWQGGFDYQSKYKQLWGK